jgi:hypothetical protein
VTNKQRHHTNYSDNYSVDYNHVRSKKNHRFINEKKLQEGINRLSSYAPNNVTPSMIMNYIVLFMQKRFANVLKLSVLMFGLIFVTYFAEIMLNNPKPIAHFSFKLLALFIAVFIGINVLRLTVLTQREKEQIPFFSSFMPFLLLHVAINVITMIVLFILTHSLILFKAEMNTQSYGILITSSFIASLISSALIIRFGFMIPALMRNPEETYQNVSSKMTSCVKFLFLTLFATKFICLNIILISDIILPYYVSLSVQGTVFALYHMLIYVFIGVSFKLLDRNTL